MTFELIYFSFTDPGTNRQPRVESVGVRFRWVKERPCIEREVYLISSLVSRLSREITLVQDLLILSFLRRLLT